jgi:hypothetical protein
MFQKKVGWAGIGNEFYFICWFYISWTWESIGTLATPTQKKNDLTSVDYVFIYIDFCTYTVKAFVLPHFNVYKENQKLLWYLYPRKITISFSNIRKKEF